MNVEVENKIKCLGEIKCFSGCGKKNLLVVLGNIDYYLLQGSSTKKWDTCATEALIRALGGVCVSIFGKEYTYCYEGDESNYVNEDGLIVTYNTDELQNI